MNHVVAFMQKLFYCDITWYFSVERLRDQLVDSKNRVSNRLNNLDDAMLECRQFNQQADDIIRWYPQFSDVLQSQPDVASMSIEQAQENQQVSNSNCVLCVINSCCEMHLAGFWTGVYMYLFLASSPLSRGAL